MDVTPTDREQPPPGSGPGRDAAGWARLIRATRAPPRHWPPIVAGLRRHTPAATWRRLRAREPEPIDPFHLWLVLLLVAITLASGLATLAQALRWV